MKLNIKDGTIFLHVTGNEMAVISGVGDNIETQEDIDLLKHGIDMVWEQAQKMRGN
jgi:hypothetical protein